MEASQPENRPMVCLDCGAALPLGADRCWLCGWKIGDPVTPSKKPTIQATAVPNPYASPAPPNNLNRTFSLSTLFLWVTLACVVMGVVRIAPGLGIGLAIVCLPAGLRTITAVRRRQRRTGQTMSVPEKLTAFFSYLGLVFAIGAAAAIAFAATCLPIGMTADMFHDEGTAISVLLLATGVGTIAALVVAFFLLRALWRAKD